MSQLTRGIAWRKGQAITLFLLGTVVVATHDPAVVEAADRKIVLDEGRLVPAEDSAYVSGR